MFASRGPWALASGCSSGPLLRTGRHVSSASRVEVMGNASQRPEGTDKAVVLEKATTEGGKPEKSREDIRDKYELGKVLGSGSFGQAGGRHVLKLERNE